MPQMMPLNWMTLFFTFIMIFIMFNMMNYFIFYNKNLMNKNIKKTNFIYMNWKW